MPQRERHAFASAKTERAAELPAAAGPRSATSIRPSTTARRLVLTIAVLLTPAGAGAWQPETLHPVWGLSEGSRFFVTTTVVRESSVQLGDLAPLNSKITDVFEVEYFAGAAIARGDTLFRVLITPVSRTVEPSGERLAAMTDRRLPRLKDVELPLMVTPDGTAHVVDGYRQTLDSLAGMDKQNQELLLTAYPTEVVQSWFAQPFWLAPPVSELKAGGTWERTDLHSLGLLGRMRTAVTLKVRDINDREASVTLQGTSRLEEPPANDQKGTQVVQFSDVTMNLDDFSGTAVLRFYDPPPPTANDTNDAETEGESQRDEAEPDSVDVASTPRPWFQELTVDLSYSGSATVTVNGQSSPLRFTQHETRTSKLTSYQIPRRLMDLPNIPRRVR
ncbi:MAG: hypothetical protein R3C19_01025 [Planctomycetaceae bacterium]